MKRRVLSFLAGAAAALALTALTATALAASGQVQFNFAGVALNGETKIAAGSDITAPNGQRVPGSILYVDEAGGKTNYLPIRTISELLGVKVGYDSATRTVLLGEQTAPASAAVRPSPARRPMRTVSHTPASDPGIDRLISWLRADKAAGGLGAGVRPGRNGRQRESELPERQRRAHLLLLSLSRRRVMAWEPRQRQILPHRHRERP